MSGGELNEVGDGVSVERGQVRRRVERYKATADERAVWYGGACAVSGAQTEGRMDNAHGK